MSVSEKLTAIADRLRGYTQETDKLSLDDMAMSADRAFQEGFEMGIDFLSLTGSPDDAFWNRFQANGKRTDYSYAFSDGGWTDTLFKPRHDMNVTTGEDMFLLSSSITNLRDIYDADGNARSMLFDSCTNFDRMFRACASLKYIGDITATSAEDLYQTFAVCRMLEEVGTLTVNENTTFTASFTGCVSLVTITFAGTVGNDLGIANSPLSKTSIESIVGCLSDEVTDKSKTLTLKSGQAANVFGSEEAFLSYVTEKGKDGWNIVY